MQVGGNMNLNELEKLKKEYLEDKSCSEEERKISLAVLNAAINRCNSNNAIANYITELTLMRKKIVDGVQPFLESKDDKIKSVAEDVCGCALNPISITSEHTFSNSIYDVVEYNDGGLKGKFELYLDSELEKNIRYANALSKKTYTCNERKYMKIEEDLSTIFPKELLEEKINKDGTFEIEQVKQNYLEIEQRISSLDIASNIKGILRNIVMDKEAHFNNYNIELLSFDDYEKEHDKNNHSGRTR